MLTLYLLVRFNHHSAGQNFTILKEFPSCKFTGEACVVAPVLPPRAPRTRTVVVVRAIIIILVVRRETRSVYAVNGMTAVPHAIRGVSAVAVKEKTILIVCLVADGEWPVLGWVPELRRIVLNFNPQSVSSYFRSVAFAAKETRSNHHNMKRISDLSAATACCCQSSVGKAVADQLFWRWFATSCLKVHFTALCGQFNSRLDRQSVRLWAG